MIPTLPLHVARVRKVINATPDTRLLTPEGIGATNLTLGEALGEIVANSLDWSLLSKQEAKNISSDAADHKNAAKFLNNLESEYGSLGKVISDDPPVITIETDLSAGTILPTDLSQW